MLTKINQAREVLSQLEESLIGLAPGLLSPDELRHRVSHARELLTGALSADLQDILKDLANTRALTIGDCTQALAAPASDPYVQFARKCIPVEGCVELDDDVVVAASEDGAQVLAWYWIGVDDLPEHANAA